MGVYTSKMRYTGTSGVDVESMIESLMKAEGAKSEKLYKQKTRLEWQQTAMRSLGTTVKGFRNNYLSFTSSSTVTNMRSASNFAGRTISGSYSGGGTLSTGTSKNVISLGSNSSIVAGTDLPTGDYKVNIESVAAKESYQGTKITGTATSNVALDITAAKLEAGDYIDMNVNGTRKRITFTADDLTAIGGDSTKFKDMLQTKIDDTFGKLNGEQKVKVSLDGGKLQFSANDTIGSTFSISKDSSVANVTNVTSGKSLFDGINTMSSTAVMGVTEGDGVKRDIYTVDGKEYKIESLSDTATPDEKEAYLTKLNATLGTNGNASYDGSGNVVVTGETFNTGGVDKYTIGGKDIEVAFAKDSGANEYLAALNKELEDKGVTASASLDDQGRLVFTPTNGEKDINVALTSRTTDAGTSTFSISGTMSANSSMINKIGFNDSDLTSSLDLTKAMGKTGTVKIGNTSIDVTADMSYQQFMDKVNAGSDAKLTYSTGSNTFKLESANSGAGGALTITDGIGVLADMNLNKDTPTTKASDAKVTITNPDGTSQTIIREENNFSYNGMTFKLDSSLQSSIDKAIADSKDKETGIPTATGIETTISVAADTNTVYDNIKKFLEDYNTLVDSLKSATTTKRAKSDSYTGYEPLTDDEKSAMSETQIKQYEEKAKQGLLNRNPEFERLQLKMREAMNSQITMEDGSKVSLASIGITTGEYSNGAKLFITDEAKLRDAIANKPDSVSAVFTNAETGVAEKLNKVIDEAVGTNGYVTTKAGFEDSVYVTDNYYSNLITSKEKDLAKLYEYLQDKENHYYSIFAAMENAINQSNSNMASLSSYSG